MSNEVSSFSLDKPNSKIGWGTNASITRPRTASYKAGVLYMSTQTTDSVVTVEDLVKFANWNLLPDHLSRSWATYHETINPVRQASKYVEAYEWRRYTLRPTLIMLAIFGVIIFAHGWIIWMAGKEIGPSTFFTDSVFWVAILTTLLSVYGCAYITRIIILNWREPESKEVAQRFADDIGRFLLMWEREANLHGLCRVNKDVLKETAKGILTQRACAVLKLQEENREKGCSSSFLMTRGAMMASLGGSFDLLQSLGLVPNPRSTKKPYKKYFDLAQAKLEAEAQAARAKREAQMQERGNFAIQ